MLALILAAFCAQSVPRRHALENHYRSNEGIYVISAVMTRWDLEHGHPTIIDLLRCGDIYAPMQFLLAQPLLALGPTDLETLRRLNIAWLAVLLVVAHLAGARLTGRREGGWLAALAVATFGSVYDFAWYYNQLLLTALFIMATLALMFSSDQLRDRRRAALAGLAMAAAFLSHRGSPPLMLGPPVALFAVLSYRRTREFKTLVNAALMIVIAVAIASPHLYDYYVRSGHVVGTSVQRGESYVLKELAMGLAALDQSVEFFRLLGSWHLTPVIGLVWVAVAAWAIWAGRRDARLWTLLVAAMLPMIWLGLFKTKNRDFLFPVIPLWGLLFSAGVFSLPDRVRARAACGVAAALVLCGWVWPAWSEGRGPSFPSFDPMLGATCRETIDALTAVPERGATVLYVNGRDDRYQPLGRDLLGCVHLSRPDLRAAMADFGDALDDTAALEVWAIAPGAPGSDTAQLLADAQLRVPPEIMVHQPSEPLPGVVKPPRPPHRRVLSTPIDNDRTVMVFLP